MRYLGGKKRQSRAIVEAVRTLRPNFGVYVEPFCGAMWSACAVIKEFPNRRFILNDVNPYLMSFWKAAIEDGWDPPSVADLGTYNKYKKERPEGDPMTGYVGFAWSFSGKFFGGFARDRSTGNRNFGKGSYKSTMEKIRLLRGAEVELSCGDYRDVLYPLGGTFYFDPPYRGRTPQSRGMSIDYDEFRDLVVRQSCRGLCLVTTFDNEFGWKVLHDYGDTVVRHLNSKGRDGTRELLLRV